MGQEIPSQEGATQCDSVAMGMYALGIMPLLTIVAAGLSAEHLKQVAFTDRQWRGGSKLAGGAEPFLAPLEICAFCAIQFKYNIFSVFWIDIGYDKWVFSLIRAIKVLLAPFGASRLFIAGGADAPPATTPLLSPCHVL